MWYYPYFTVLEMACKCGCGGLPKDEFMRALVTIREDANFPFKISSGYRCAVYNTKVADSGSDGPHVQGVAADILLYGLEAIQLIQSATKHGITGIGVAQKGTRQSRFIHIDMVQDTPMQPRPWIWSY